jgi:beta-galactosidase
MWWSGDPDSLLDRSFSMNLSGARSISRNFVIMEQQSGPGGWVNWTSPNLKPGQARLWTYQSIAHGANLVVYFRWRTAVSGQEIYWHGINDHHNRPNRRIEEIAGVARELDEIGETIARTQNVRQAAILKSYVNDWDAEFDAWCQTSNPRSTDAWFKALQQCHIQVDSLVVESGLSAEDLSEYAVVIVPQMAVLTEPTAAMLRAYVEGGGNLVVGCRSGYKDESGHCLMRPAPGPISELCGVEVLEYTVVRGTAPPLAGRLPGIDGRMADAFNEILTPIADNTEVLATYAGDYYAGAPALTRNAIGAGCAYYYGAAFNSDIAGALIDAIGLRPLTEGWIDIPAAVELTVRTDRASQRRLHFLLNYTGEKQSIAVSSAALELLTGERTSEELVLAPYGVAILERI